MKPVIRLPIEHYEELEQQVNQPHAKESRALVNKLLDKGYVCAEIFGFIFTTEIPKSLLKGQVFDGKIINRRKNNQSLCIELKTTFWE